MKKLVWAMLCIFTFSPYAVIAEEVTTNAPASQEAPAATESTGEAVAEDTATEGLTTTEMVMVGAAVVGAAAIASNSSSTSHHP